VPIAIVKTKDLTCFFPYLLQVPPISFCSSCFLKADLLLMLNMIRIQCMERLAARLRRLRLRLVHLPLAGKKRLCGASRTLGWQSTGEGEREQQERKTSRSLCHM